MGFSVNDVVEVVIGSTPAAKAAPLRTVLGVVTEPFDGRAGGAVRVLIGAGQQGPQIIDATQVRLVAPGSTMMWSGTDTHAMIGAAAGKRNSSLAPSPKDGRRATAGGATHGRTAGATTPARYAERNEGVGGRLSVDHEEDPLATVCSSPSEASLDSEDNIDDRRQDVHSVAHSPRGGLPHGPDMDEDTERDVPEDEGNVLRTLSATADAVMCGESLLVCAAFFALLTLWVLTGEAAHAGPAVALRKTFIILSWVGLARSGAGHSRRVAQRSATSALALYRLALLSVLVGVGCGGHEAAVVSCAMMVVLWVMCAVEFDARERSA